MQQQRAGAIGEGVHVGSGCKGRVSCQGLGDIVVGAVDIMVFTSQHAIEPIQDVLMDRHLDVVVTLVVCQENARSVSRGMLSRILAVIGSLVEDEQEA